MDTDHSLLKYKRYYTYIEPFFKAPIIRTYTGIILSVLTISFFTAFAIRPTIKTIVSLNKQIEDGKYTDKQLQEKINSLSLAQGELNAIKNDLPIVYASLPDNPSVPGFLSLMERGAASSGIIINSLQMQSVSLLASAASSTATPTTGSKEIPFALSADGKYQDLLSFLKLTRELKRLVNIDNIVMGKSRQEGEGALTLTIDGKMFYYNK